MDAYAVINMDTEELHAVFGSAAGAAAYIEDTRIQQLENASESRDILESWHERRYAVIQQCKKSPDAKGILYYWLLHNKKPQTPAISNLYIKTVDLHL
jgi:hypothetical protein